MSCQSAIEKKPNHYLCASKSEKKSARSKRKSWFCHLINPSSLQKTLPFTLLSHQVPITTPSVKTANTVLPALLWPGCAGQTVPAATKSHNLRAAFVSLLPCLSGSAGVTLSPCLKLETNCRIKYWLLFYQWKAAPHPEHSWQRSPLGYRTQGTMALLQKLSCWLWKSMWQLGLRFFPASTERDQLFPTTCNIGFKGIWKTRNRL